MKKTSSLPSLSPRQALLLIREAKRNPQLIRDMIAAEIARRKESPVQPRIPPTGYPTAKEQIWLNGTIPLDPAASTQAPPVPLDDSDVTAHVLT